MKHIRLLLAGLIVLVLLIIAAVFLREGAALETVTLRSSDGKAVTVRAEIADAPEERQQGLMNRTSLPDGRGMLFVFDEVQVLSFWMKNTLIPLDILYFDADGKLVSGTTMTPCRADPCPNYSSNVPAKYALEVPAGFTKKHSVGNGWRLESR